MSPGLGTSTWVTSGRFGIFECIYLHIKKMLSFCENPTILISGTSSNYLYNMESSLLFFSAFLLLPLLLSRLSFLLFCENSRVPVKVKMSKRILEARRVLKYLGT